MKMVIKRVAVVLMTVIMMVVMLPVQNVKAEEDTYTVYVQVPDSWGTPYIWAWGDSGVGKKFRDWPGDIMNDDGNGVYSYTLEDKYYNLVISDNGSTQTKDLMVNGTDVEIIVSSNGSCLVNFLEGNQTEWENGITVTVSIPSEWENPYIWAWDDTKGDVYANWPGAVMTLSGDKYIAELPDWVTGVIINANNASVQTVDISVESGKDIWLQVNSTNDVIVDYSGEVVEELGDDNAEEDTTTVADDGSTANNESTTAQSVDKNDNNKGNDKPNNNNVIYIVVPVAVFVIIILIVTFTGNGRNKKHSRYKYVDDAEVGDIKIDEDDLDIDVDDIDV